MSGQIQSDEWYYSLGCHQLQEMREALDRCYKRAGFAGKMLGECKEWNDYYTKCIRKNVRLK